jgi:hypothetical protein
VDEVFFFSGFIRCGTYIHPHLPERVLRQFGHLQSIPRLPPAPCTSIADVDHAWGQYPAHIISEVARGPQADVPSHVEAYMTWYHRISHPYILPDVDRPQPQPEAESMDVGGSSSQDSSSLEVMCSVIPCYLIIFNIIELYL